MRERRAARGVAAALAATVLAFGVHLVAAPAALAHAELEKSSPANGAVLASAPSAVRLTFGEAVTPDAAGLLTRDGTPVAITMTSSQGGIVVVITPTSPLSKGPYVATWRVTSDDGHTVSGAISFIVGSRPATGRPVAVSTVPSVPLRLSGSRPGALVASIGRTVSSGTLQWSHAGLVAPLTWRVGGGPTAQSHGVLPWPGEWKVRAFLTLSGGALLAFEGTVTLTG